MKSSQGVRVTFNVGGFVRKGEAVIVTSHQTSVCNARFLVLESGPGRIETAQNVLGSLTEDLVKAIRNSDVSRLQRVLTGLQVAFNAALDYGSSGSDKLYKTPPLIEQITRALREEFSTALSSEDDRLEQ